VGEKKGRWTPNGKKCTAETPQGGEPVQLPKDRLKSPPQVVIEGSAWRTSRRKEATRGSTSPRGRKKSGTGEKGEDPSNPKSTTQEESNPFQERIKPKNTTK